MARKGIKVRDKWAPKLSLHLRLSIDTCRRQVNIRGRQKPLLDIRKEEEERKEKKEGGRVNQKGGEQGERKHYRWRRKSERRGREEMKFGGMKVNQTQQEEKDKQNSNG